MSPHYRIPLSVPDLAGNEAAYLQRCITDSWISTAGPFVDEMEARMAALTGRDHAIATASGSAALHLAVIAAGARPGERVIVPDWTFGATVNVVLYTGAVPVLTDVTRSSWTLDPELVATVFEDADQSADDRIAAVIPVHALGHPADLDPLRELCSRHGAALIEDAAGAICARYKGNMVGTASDAAMFSFNGNKTVTAGGGGVVVTDDAAWADRMRLLSVHRASQWDTAPNGHYRYEAVGYNYRMTNLSAAVGLAQLERLDELVGRKSTIAARYDRALDGRGDLAAMPRAEWADSNCWLYSVICGSKSDAESLVRHMAEQLIQARVFWQALSAQAPYRNFPTVSNGVAAVLADRVVSLPCSTGMSDAEQDIVIDVLRAWRGDTEVGAEWTSS